MPARAWRSWGICKVWSTMSRHPPGRPGEFHPGPPTDPDVNLSIHPARATQRRLPPSIKTRSSSGYPLTPSRRSAGITPPLHYYEAVRPWPVHRYFRPHGFSTWAFSLCITDPVLKFRTKARIRVMPPVHRTPA